MSTLTRQVHVHNGRIALEDLPFTENTELTVLLMPTSLPIFQPNLSAWMEARRLTEAISGSLADDIAKEREEL
ncbi:MAG: hypothetical protein EAZ92_06435 [Candidatus Kapaibacterium sp.]|nr:MAG: hypothetical protein EAZ92_06435 [Candidatus Kapabacteria bacterium]